MLANDGQAVGGSGKYRRGQVTEVGMQAGGDRNRSQAGQTGQGRLASRQEESRIGGDQGRGNELG